MSKIDKVRVIVVGDSGVGKSSLTHLITYGKALMRPGWTVGCSVEVKLHEFKEGTQKNKSFFVELVDIGGSLSHKNTRGVFYNSTNGIILVHDLTNRKSHENLRSWVLEILNKDGKDTIKSDDGAFDPENFFGSTQTPILVVGTKLDLLDEKRRLNHAHSRTEGIAEQCGADEICLKCHDIRSLAAGTSDAVKLARFFDKVIEKKYYSAGLYGEKRIRHGITTSSGGKLLQPNASDRCG